MLLNTARNINLAPLTFWSNNWGVLYTSEEFTEGAVKSETTKGAGSSEMKMDADVSNSKLMLNFYF